jgi:plastocyanin
LWHFDNGSVSQRNGIFGQNLVTTRRQQNLRFLLAQRFKRERRLFYFLSVYFFALGCSPKDQSATTSPSSSHYSAAPTVVEAPNQVLGRSTIIGRVFFKGEAPKPKLIRMNQDRACEQEGGAAVYSEEAVIDADGALANVFVYIKDGLGQRRYVVPTTPVILDQHRCRYEPRVFGIQAGQTLKILNRDHTLHNVHASATQNKSFNIAMSAVQKERTRVFDKPEVMIPLRCNVHPWMIAYAGVLDHPFYSVTDSTGSYNLSALPAGEYEIEAWHELFGTLAQNVKITEAETQTMNFTFTRR